MLKYVCKENLITVESVSKGYSFWILGYLEWLNYLMQLLVEFFLL